MQHFFCLSAFSESLGLPGACPEETKGRTLQGLSFLRLSLPRIVQVKNAKEQSTQRLFPCLVGLAQRAPTKHKSLPVKPSCQNHR